MTNLLVCVFAGVFFLLLNRFGCKIKIVSISFAALFIAGGALSQKNDTIILKKVLPKIDTIVPGHGAPKQQIKQSKEIKKALLSDSAGGSQPKKSPLIDTTVKNKYGDLLNDDIHFNKKYPVWKPAVEVVVTNGFIWAMDRFIFNEPFSHISPSTWGYNIHKGWEWDDDRFGLNFIGHPYSGTFYFNAARSQGYNFVQSVPFAIGGSLMWEYFGENTRPSYNDIINTSLNGPFLGEMSYRLSSNILDDRTYSSERFFRELIAGVIDPERALNRLLQGKSFRHTSTEVYQKEPLNIIVSAGMHKINSKDKSFLGIGPSNPLVNIQLDYGNPFEDIRRKPFDLFRLRTEFSFGVGRKVLDNVLGYGVLFGGNAKLGKLSVMYGAFQYYDYWDNRTFELGALGFGGGLISKYPISKDISLYTNFHLSGIPLAGNSTRYGPDTSQVRDYTYNDGMGAKFEATLNFGKFVSASLSYYYYILHTFEGPAGNNYVAILRPRINVQLYKDLSIGFEDFQYYDDRYLQNFRPVYSTRTEQKIYLTWFFEDPQRKGRYN